MRRFPLSSVLLLFFSVCSNAILAAETYGPVQSGDSLWKISRDHRPSANITVNQTMIATFRKNSDAFGGNINWLYIDRTLALPTAKEAADIPVTEADAEVARQNEAWKSAVDKFVAADAKRRQQLNTVISGQPSDDPEIQALRAELRKLVGDLREENQRLKEELAAANTEKKRQMDFSCENAGGWCLGLSLWLGRTSDFLIVRDFTDSAPLFSVDSVDRPILGFHAIRRLDDLWPETWWSLRTGVEYASVKSTGHFSDADKPSPQPSTATYGIDYLRLPVILHRDLDINVEPVFGNQAVAYFGAGLVLNVAVARELTFKRPALETNDDFTEHLNVSSIVPSLSLDAGIGMKLENGHRVGVELVYEKTLEESFDGLQQGNSPGSLITTFQPGKWYTFGLRTRYQF